MKALIYHGPEQKDWESKVDSRIERPTDAVVRIDTTTICGTDLHILKGDVPEVAVGRTLGHEAVGTVVEIGSGVENFKEGDKILVSCISACGRCAYCRRGMLPAGDVRPVPAGWRLGPGAPHQRDPGRVCPHTFRGQQPIRGSRGTLRGAGHLSLRYPAHGLRGRRPEREGRTGRQRRGCGAGPIGLATMLSATLYGPSRIIAIDLADSRVAQARRFGADTIINNAEENPVEKVMELTDGLGADVAMEAVGVPETFELCAELVRPGGHVANLGVHGAPATLHLEKLWIKDVTITTGLVDTYSTPTLLRLVAEGRLDPTPFVTHRFGLGEILAAYDTFADAAHTEALKVVLSAN